MLDQTVLDMDRLEHEASDLRARYVSARPYPHIVLEDFLCPDIMKLAMEEFASVDRDRWMHYFHVNERKFSSTDPSVWGPTLRSILAELNSPRFVRFLTALTGIDDLLIDESLEGGGLHQSVRGGYLNIHADYTVHPHRRDWRRRVNLLLYFNEGWLPEYGGDLELWSQDMKRCEEKIAPVGNRAVIFTTDADSFHGHPEPMRCPEEAARRSMALYYFTQEHDPMVRSTNYRARPGDGLRSLLIYTDKEVLKAFDWAKRRLGVSDEAGTKFLQRLEGLRSRIRK
jgi:hypothetical protein